MMGRPSKYEELLEQGLLIRVEGWARDGLTNEQIANNLQIHVDTLYEWQKKYTEFSESLKRSKEIADREVENALFNKAIGQTMTEQQAIKLKTVHYKDGKRIKEEERVEIVDVEKVIPPDTTAQIFWLKNRKSDVWRDKQNIEHSGGTDDSITVKLEGELDEWSK